MIERSVRAAMGSKSSPLLLTCLLLVRLPAPGGAEPSTTIRNNGDPANRVDVAILGDGYTASELGKYASDVEGFVSGMFASEALLEYRSFFNVHRVDVTSIESGADHPSRGVFKNTALDAAYDCAGIQRLICVNVGKVNTVLSTSLSPQRRDIALVIVNDGEYGGSGGAVAVSSTHPSGLEIVLHELGHSFGLLADEYGGPPPPNCNASFEPSEVNVTKQTTRTLIKWNVWINPFTPVPTFGSQEGVPGLYEGGRYCDFGLYRSTYDSKMRSLFKPWDPINNEQIVKRIYNWVSPIDSRFPTSANVTLTAPETFRVHLPSPLTHSLQTTWRIDGGAAGAGPLLLVNPAALSAGAHVIDADVVDPTPFVLQDPAQLLRETAIWNVTVPNTPPFAPSEPSPGDGIGGVCTNGVSLSWSGGDPNAEQSVTYDVYFGTANPPPLETSDLTDRLYPLGALTNGTAYFWEIVAEDDMGATTGGPLWSFTTTTGGPCSYSLASPSADFDSSGGVASIGVFAPCGCDWTAVSNEPWISILSGAAGLENGTVTYAVEPSLDNAHRTGTLTIGGETFTVHQNRVIPRSFFTVSPCRLVDTRDPVGPRGGPALAAGSGREFTIAGACGIPATATAVSLNVAVTGGTAPGNLRLHAGGTPVPLIASINFGAAQTRSNNAVAPLNPNGKLAVFSNLLGLGGTVHLILDVNGYFEEN